MHRAIFAVVVSVATSAAVVQALGAAPPAKPRTFLTWSATVNSTALSAQGTRTSLGTAAYDEASNRSAWVHGNTGGNYVADFSAGVVYNIDAQGNCQSVCSLTGDTLCNSQINGNALCGYDYENRAQYVDTVTLYNGQAYHYAYIDPLGPIPMAEHEIYISTKTGLPLRFLADFMPFGKWLANITSDYTDFSTDAPDPSLFTVKGEKYCQPADDNACSNEVRDAAYWWVNFAGFTLG